MLVDENGTIREMTKEEIEELLRGFEEDGLYN